jgi:hypothetical protein
MAPRSCDSSTHASSSSGLMPLEAAISFGREPEYSTTHNSARRKRAGPRLNMGDASEIVCLLLYAILFRSKLGRT